MNVQWSKLQYDGKEYKKVINPPTCREILKPSTEELIKQLAVDISPGEIHRLDNQEFVGFSACVRTLEEVNAAYARVRTLHAEARHVVGACALPGCEFPILMDSHDDDEHGLGDHLLQLLEASRIKNRAVFVARYYNGTHIGEKRIDAFWDAACSAILVTPLNSVTGDHQHPLHRRTCGKTVLPVYRTDTQ